MPDLPRPTADRDRALADLDTHGYCVVENALNPARLAALRERLIEQAEGECAAGVSFHDGVANQRVWMLVNKGQVFRDLVLDPLTERFMGELLGPDFLLSSLTANIARPGGVPMGLHTDQGYVHFWTPRPVVANIAWMIDGFSDENGGTRVVPGSHREPFRNYDAAETVAAVGPPGSALVFDGRIVHGTGENRTATEQRHAILSYFCRPFMRQQENFFLGLAPELEHSEREAFLARLGYRIWAGLGRIESPAERGLMSRGCPVGELDRSGAKLGAIVAA